MDMIKASVEPPALKLVKVKTVQELKVILEKGGVDQINSGYSRYFEASPEGKEEAKKWIKSQQERWAKLRKESDYGSET